MRDFFDNMRLSRKILASTLIIAIIPFVIMAYYAWQASEEALTEAAFNKLISIREAKTSEIRLFFDAHVADVNILSNTLALFYQQLESDGKDELATLSQDPHYDDFFKKTAESYGYHDLFLIEPKGQIIYSVAKEADFQTNILTGVYSETHLGQTVKKVLDQQTVVMSDYAPYSASNNKPTLFLGTVVKVHDEVKFLLVLQIADALLNNIMNQRAGLGERGEVYLVGQDHLMRSNSLLDPINHSVYNSFKHPELGKVNTQSAQAALSGKTGIMITKDYLGNPVLSAYAPLIIEENHWAVLAEIDEHQALADIEALIFWIKIIAIFGLLIIIITALSLSQHIKRPLENMVVILEKIAKGDLRMNMGKTGQNETGKMLGAAQEMSQRMSQIIYQVQEKAATLASAAEELSATSQAMSQNAAEQAASVEETSASLEQMSSSIAQNNENAKITDHKAQTTATQANEGGEAVRQTVDAMREITKKISIIEEIAYKTNMLALNAAIEAARAGVHGRGFAVVAVEVQKLAENSQTAAKDIRRLAADSVSVAEKAGHLLTEIVPNVQRTADLVQEISAASTEQSIGVGQINNAMGQLDQTTQQIASSAEELSATAEEVTSQAANLQELVTYFKINLSEFNTEVDVKPVPLAEPDPILEPTSTLTKASPAFEPAHPPIKAKHYTAVSHTINEKDFEQF